MSSKPEVIHELKRLHEEYALVPANKACNNIVFVGKTHYYNCTLYELGINSTYGNLTFIQLFTVKMKFFKTIGPF
jgi:hypothetical protein